MKKYLTSFLQGLLVAAICALWFERKQALPAARPERQPETGTTATGLDLNQASVEELLRLPGLNRELVDRIMENRPYRNKLDLISRLVIAQENYEPIKHLVYVPPEAAHEPVKVAG
jgi:DNA uptake protein ComE-like DNA-binding protein